MTRPTPRRLAVSAIALAGTALYLGANAHADASALDPSATAVLIEGPHCQRPTADAPTDTSGPGTGQNAQSLTVTIPATALLALDTHGRVVAATTNTGCAPRSTDDVYHVMPDGSVRAASGQLPALAWVGDFTAAGVAAAQTP